MYVVADHDGNWLSDFYENRPDDTEAWRVWDCALVDGNLPSGNYPRVRKV